MRQATYIFIFLVVTACGVFQPEFKNYVEEETTTPAAADTECGAAALALFTEKVGISIDKTCATAGCHASGSAGASKFPLTAAQNDANRSIVFTYTGFDRTKLTTKISSTTHGGGNQSANLSKENITAWLDKEELCATP